MRSDTRSATLDAPPDQVFDYLADPMNLPTWAVGFARAVRRSGDAWLVTTGHGEVGLRVAANATLGTIDFHMTPAPGVTVSAYSRVLASHDGSEYVFTQFQAPGMPDAAFEAQIATLREELTVLQSIVRARTACPS